MVFLCFFVPVMLVFAASPDSDCSVDDRAKQGVCQQGCRDVFLGARHISVIVWLMQGKERYSARWNINQKATRLHDHRSRTGFTCKTLWERMYEAFSKCSEGSVQLGQRFYSESLDTITPILIRDLEAPPPGRCPDPVVYDGFDGWRLTNKHISDLSFKLCRLWSVSMISEDFESSDVLNGRAVRFVVPEMNLMLEGIEGLCEKGGKIFDLERRIWD